MMDYMSPHQLGRPPKGNNYSSSINSMLPRLETLSPPSTSASGKMTPDRKLSANTSNVPSSSSKTEVATGSIFDPHLIPPYLTWRKPYPIGPGFFNEGNTCYLNSTLQCLLYVPPFTQLLLNESKEVFRSCLKTNNINTSGSAPGLSNGFGLQKSILELYNVLLQDVYQCINNPGGSSSSGKGGGGNGRGGGNTASISPKSMVQSLRRIGKQFQVGTQEDAHEYLRQLLDTLHEEILKNYKLTRSDGRITETTFISRLFGGTLCNTVTCVSCGYFSQTFNHFEDMSLDIKHPSIHSIEQAIAYFQQVEYLSSGNEWKCDGCKRKVKASKQMTIGEVPNVLVLHLKRFSFENMFAKVTKHIQFPVQLPITYQPITHYHPEGITGSKGGGNAARLEEQSIHVGYALTGVVVHHGYSINAGHYIAYVQAGNGQWYEMNDSQVIAVSMNTVLQANAYILFYTKTTPTPLLPHPSPVTTTTTSATITTTTTVRNSMTSTMTSTSSSSSSGSGSGSGSSSGSGSGGSKYSSASSNDIPSYVVRGATGAPGAPLGTAAVVAGTVGVGRGTTTTTTTTTTNRDVYCDILEHHQQHQQSVPSPSPGGMLPRGSTGSTGSQTSRSSHYPYISNPNTNTNKHIPLAKQHSLSDLPVSVTNTTTTHHHHTVGGSTMTSTGTNTITNTGTNTGTITNTGGASTSYLSPFQGLFHTMTNVFRRPSFTLSTGTSSTSNTPRATATTTTTAVGTAQPLMQSASQGTQTIIHTTASSAANSSSSSSSASGSMPISGSGKYGHSTSGASGGSSSNMSGGGGSMKKKRTKQSVIPVNSATTTNNASSNSPYRSTGNTRTSTNYRYRPDNY